MDGAMPRIVMPESSMTFLPVVGAGRGDRLGDVDGVARRDAGEHRHKESRPLEDTTEVPKGLEGIYEQCLPYYEELHERRMRPGG
jgi:hypothetical protein